MTDDIKPPLRGNAFRARAVLQWLQAAGANGHTLHEMATMGGVTTHSIQHATHQLCADGLCVGILGFRKGVRSASKTKTYFLPQFAPAQPATPEPSTSIRASSLRPQGAAIETEKTRKIIGPSGRDFRYSVREGEAVPKIFGALRYREYLPSESAIARAYA